MRTPEEILARLKEIKKEDIFGFMSTNLIAYLPYENAKPYLERNVTEEEWAASPRDHAMILADMLDYMPFAWDKANNTRGISSMRSMEHMKSWLWMLGRENDAGRMEYYTYYGKTELRAICECFEWDWKQWDDGEWRNNEDEEPVPPPDNVFTLGAD